MRDVPTKGDATIDTTANTATDLATAAATAAPAARPHSAIRPEWLALRNEEAIEADLPIVDAHHHLWQFPEKRYLADDLIRDIGTRQAVVSTVFIECTTNYRTTGPVAMQPLGEVEFAAREAASPIVQSAVTPQLCAAIVGYADLALGDAVRPVLDALIAAAPERMRGIRNIAVWHPDPTARASVASPPPRLMADPKFLEGFHHLGALNLSFDAWLVHTQLDELSALAAAFPDTPIVLNHLGGPLGIGPYKGKRDEVFEDWQAGLKRLAKHDNVRIKLGGFGMRFFGFDFDLMQAPPSSMALAEFIAPYVNACIQIFGCERCMFESNFPVDKGSFNYTVLWNAYKRITTKLPPGARAALFHGTAARFYRLPH